MRYSKSNWGMSIAGSSALHKLVYVLTLLCAAFMVTACARPAEPTAPDAPPAVERSNASMETETSAETVSAHSDRITSVPAAQSQSATAVLPASTPAGAVASSAPASPFGPPTLDERIFFADVIALVRPISVEPLILTLNQTDEKGQTLYSPAVQTRFTVVEYLKGDGGSEVVADAKNFNTRLSSSDQALQIAENKASAQLSGLGSDEAVVFLRGSEYYPNMVEDISLKSDEIEWRQHNTEYGIFSSGGEISSASTTFRTASESYADTERTETFSIDVLRERIDAMEALLREGEGIEGYEQCLWSKFQQENYLRTWIMASVYDIGTFESGMHVGFVLQEFSTTYPRQWFTGGDAHLFNYGSYEVTTTRPMPAGAYEVNEHFQKSEWTPCDYVPPPATWRYTFESAADVLHEAFFDPVAIGDAVGADSDNGVLRPETLNTDDEDEVDFRRIDWQDGQATLELSPSVDLTGHKLDFIVLDGSVSLRLAFEDAGVTEEDGIATLTWGVCEQPWEEGDLLMLRIADGIRDDGVVATNDSGC